MIVHHCWQNTPTGELLQVAIENLVVEIGLHGPLWKQPFNKFSHWTFPHSFLYHVCQFNQDNNIEINIQHMELSPKRDNDTAIIEKVLMQLETISHWKAVNRVRMFRKVVNISDITSADSKVLD